MKKPGRNAFKDYFSILRQRQILGFGQKRDHRDAGEEHSAHPKARRPEPFDVSPQAPGEASDREGCRCQAARRPKL